MNSNFNNQSKSYWSFALTALRSKVKVSRRSWNNNQYLESTNRTDIIYHNVSLTLADYDADDWMVYSPTYTINDIKFGQKFKCKQYHNKDSIFVKFYYPNIYKSFKYQGYQEYLNIETGEFWHINPTEVNSFVVEPVQG